MQPPSYYSFYLLLPSIITSFQNPPTLCSPCHRHSLPLTFTTTTTTLHLSSSSPPPDERQQPRRERAGASGYSILRQPVNWDLDQNPRFEPPSQLKDDGNDDQLGFSWLNDANSIKKRTAPRMASSLTTNDKTQQQQQPSSRTSKSSQSVDLYQRTMDTLDYPAILSALADQCDTIAGKKLVLNATTHHHNHTTSLYSLTAYDANGIHFRYNAINEMQEILSRPPSKKRGGGGPPPMGHLTLTDLEDVFARADDGNVLDGPAILDVSSTIQSLLAIQKWANETLGDEHSSLAVITASISLPNETFTNTLINAFDDTGSLSSTTFPIVGNLRRRVREAKSSILQTLHNDILPKQQAAAAASSDTAPAPYSEINGRIVIPLPLSTANRNGIVHDISRSGKTAYVEPTPLIGPTNDLRRLENELKREEEKVWRTLTQMIIKHRMELEESLRGASCLDVVMGRWKLGRVWDGVVPEVKEGGVIKVKNARHPALLLKRLKRRGIGANGMMVTNDEDDEVVGNDVEIGTDHDGLILTGPNSGGKTIVLKLLGLLALMVRDGIPLPVDGGTADTPLPRVDVFSPILADIGDLQTIDDDLSTFTGHLVVCREVLSRSSPNALVLMDELGSGTDPDQGVALAQSILEKLLDDGAKVAITTHYLRLKQLAASDERFAVAGMQFLNNRPTYKLQRGIVGESFALAVAERLGLPPVVLSRVNELLSDETRYVGDLMTELEAQKEEVERRSASLRQKQQEMDEMTEEMEKLKQQLAREKLYARRDEVKAFIESYWRRRRFWKMCWKN